MPYQIAQQESALKVEITDIGNQGPDLLASFQACQEGRCNCPTNEYEKLEDLEVIATEEKIQLRLTPTDGTLFDPDQIATCLDFTLASAGLTSKKK